MSHTRFSRHNRAGFLTLALLSLAAPWSLVHAGRVIDQSHAADSDGTVEIFDISGDLEIVGWDRAEIQVSGTADDRIEKIDLTVEGHRTAVHVIQRTGSWHMGGDDTHLIIHVPAKSELLATLVSTNLKLNGLAGDVTLRTVSGDVSGAVDGDLHANTVSGNVTLAAHAAHRIEVKSISGDIRLDGGAGDIEISTVSGDAKIALATLTRGRFKSISGDLTTSLSLSPDAQLEAQSVSGSLRFNFPEPPAAEFDIQTYSGDIGNCFGPKPIESHYGPGSRLMFKNGDGHARVRIETKSGDVKLCDKKAAAGHVSLPAHTAQSNYQHVDFRYVL